MKRFIVVILTVLCFGTLFTFAGDEPKTPPSPAKYVWVQNVTVAESKAEAYPALCQQFRHAAEASKAENYWLSASALTGDLRLTSFVSGYHSFAAAEAAMANWEKIVAEGKKVNPNIVAETAASELSPRAAIAVYREDLSYRPTAVSVADAKYWQIKTIHIGAGHRRDFDNLIKEDIELLKKASIDDQFLVYEIMMGAPTTGTAYYMVTYLKSLADLDIDNSDKVSTVFTPMIRTHFDSTVEKIVTSVYDELLMVRPDMSRPPQATIAANPDFWTIKEPAPVVAKGKGKKIAIEAENIKPRQ